jgi:ABC-2 type transport system ATP-binding protein
MEEVEILCDRVIILDKGKILAQGSTESIKDLAKIEEKVTVEVNSLPYEIIEKIKALKHVDDVIYENNILLISFRKGTNNLVNIIEFLKNEKINYSKIFSERPTLNYVFLELTGKELRD